MEALICAEWLLLGPAGQRITDGAVFVCDGSDQGGRCQS